MATVLGLATKLFTQTDGVSGSAGWNEVSNVRDLTSDLSLATADVTTRAGGGYRQKVGTLAEGTVSFEMVYDTADARFTEIQAAFFARSTFGAKILDGGTESTGKGLVADFVVINFSIKQELENAMIADVEIAVARGSTPSWQTGS